MREPVMITDVIREWLRVPHALTLLRIHSELYQNGVDTNIDCAYRGGGLRSLTKVTTVKEPIDLKR